MKKKLDDITHFYEAYGEANPSNYVTLKIENLHCKKWDLQSYLEADLGQIEETLLKYRKKLKQLEEEAEAVDCACLKTKI